MRRQHAEQEQRRRSCSDMPMTGIGCGLPVRRRMRAAVIAAVTCPAVTGSSSRPEACALTLVPELKVDRQKKDDREHARGEEQRRAPPRGGSSRP